MTRREAIDLYGWLRDTYHRNYATADERRAATVIDNLARVFANNSFKEIMDEYQRVFTYQKTEPHPSDIRAAIKGVAKRKIAAEELDPYEALRRHPKYAEMEYAYGARACRRAAKLCTEKCSIDELKFRLEHDIPCTEKDYSEEIKRFKEGKTKLSL